MKVENLSDIVLALRGNGYGNYMVERAIEKASKGFRPSSPNDVKHYTFLATCLYIIGDRVNGKAILLALDRETAVLDNRADLAGELASARVFLAHIYGLEGKVDLRKQILDRDDIGDCLNLENIDYSTDKRYENEIEDHLAGCYYGLKELERDTSIPRREQQRFAYQCYLYTVIYTERLDEYRSKISKDDEDKLAESLDFIRDKLSYYIGLSSSNSS